LDIGANIGYVSACFLHNVLQSTVAAVEPQPLVYELLSQNLRQFGSDRSKTFQCAISKNDGVGHLQICTENTGASRLADNGIAVNIWSAERLLSELDSEPDLIKIDVEGHEEQVISSLLSALNKRLPRAILYEDHGDKSSPEKPIGSMLGSAGYDVFAVIKRLTGLNLLPVSSTQQCIANDYIAVRKQGL
jgi:FkbM family methyltransferase